MPGGKKAVSVTRLRVQSRLGWDWAVVGRPSDGRAGGAENLEIFRPRYEEQGINLHLII